MSNDKLATKTRIEEEIAAHPVLLFMKGAPSRPQCGFSQRACQILQACKTEFASVDILSDPEVRATLPDVSGWPTFPQLFIDGELVGGSDIMLEMYQSGELQELLQANAG